MQGYLVKPGPVCQVYVAGSDNATRNAMVEFVRSLKLKPVIARRNQEVEADWHILADIYNHNLKALLECDLMLALLDGKSTDNADTCVEIGLAYANGISVLGLCVSSELRASPMIVGMCGGDEQIVNSIEELKDLINEHIEMVNAALADTPE